MSKFLMALVFVTCAACAGMTRQQINGKAATAALDCGGLAIQSLLNYVPQVTLALAQPDYQSKLSALEPELATKGIGDGVTVLGCVIKHVLAGMPARSPGYTLTYALPGEQCVEASVQRALLPTDKICPPPSVGTAPVPLGTSMESLVRARAELWLRMQLRQANVRGERCTCLRDSECPKGYSCSYCQCSRD